MDHLHIDARKQEMLEARLLGSKVCCYQQEKVKKMLNEPKRNDIVKIVVDFN